MPTQQYISYIMARTS